MLFDRTQSNFHLDEDDASHDELHQPDCDDTQGEAVEADDEMSFSGELNDSNVQPQAAADTDVQSTSVYYVNVPRVICAICQGRGL